MSEARTTTGGLRRYAALAVLGAGVLCGLLLGPRSQAQDEGAPTPLVWEEVPAENNLSAVRTLRARVPGGWLVHTKETWGTANGNGIGVGLTFLPDPQHTWRVR